MCSIHNDGVAHGTKKSNITVIAAPQPSTHSHMQSPQGKHSPKAVNWNGGIHEYMSVE